ATGAGALGIPRVGRRGPRGPPACHGGSAAPDADRGPALRVTLREPPRGGGGRGRRGRLGSAGRGGRRRPAGRADDRDGPRDDSVPERGLRPAATLSLRAKPGGRPDAHRPCGAQPRAHATPAWRGAVGTEVSVKGPN